MLASVVGEEWTEPGELLRLETGDSIREIWGHILRQRTLEWRKPGNEDEAVTVDLPSEMGCLQPDPHMQSGLET